MSCRAAGELFARSESRQGVAFALADLRTAAPPGPFDVILCRNSAFTYFVGSSGEAVGVERPLREANREAAQRPDGLELSLATWHAARVATHS